MGIIAPNFYASNGGGKATGSTGSSKHNNRLGRRQAHPEGRKQELERSIVASTQGVTGGKLKQGALCFHILLCSLPQHTYIKHHLKSAIDTSGALTVCVLLSVNIASACHVSLHHLKWRCLLVADRIPACPRSHPAKSITASSCTAPLARHGVAWSSWNGKDAVEIVTLDDHRSNRGISKDRFIHAVLHHVDDIEGFIEILFCSRCSPQ